VGEIQVTEDMFQLVNRQYSFENRSFVKIKGKGEMLIYLLKSHHNADPN
jgi:hypothetical protein